MLLKFVRPGSTVIKSLIPQLKSLKEKCKNLRSDLRRVGDTVPGQEHNTVILRVVFTHSFTLIISIAQGCRFVNTIG